MGVEQMTAMKPFKTLLSREKALEIISGNIERIERVEELPIGEASGRVLAEGVPRLIQALGVEGGVRGQGQ